MKSVFFVYKMIEKTGYIQNFTIIQIQYDVVWSLIEHDSWTSESFEYFLDIKCI